MGVMPAVTGRWLVPAGAGWASLQAESLQNRLRSSFSGDRSVVLAGHASLRRVFTPWTRGGALKYPLPALIALPVRLPWSVRRSRCTIAHIAKV